MNERVCRVALVMPCSTGLASAGALPSADALGVLLVELLAVDLLADQERGVAGVDDLDLLQHLANDHLDVLVVDLHALQSIDVLDLVDEVVGQRLDAQHVAGCRAAPASRRSAGRPSDVVAFLHGDVLALRDQVLARPCPDRRPPGPRGCGAWPCSPCRTRRGRRSRDDRVVLRAARLEQLGHARQTAGDVAGLGRLRAGCGPARRRPSPARRSRPRGSRPTGRK